VESIAAKKGLPLPIFEIQTPAVEVPANLRQFVGIWISDFGFTGSGRQWMTVVVSVNAEGRAWGYHSRGPAMPNSTQTPAKTLTFTGLISGGTLVHSTTDSKVALSFTTQRRLQYQEHWNAGPRSGERSTVVLNPIWALVDAERLASKK
jgi:hypothetical protein